MAVDLRGSNLVTGSWFPSGYHGHFRSKPRSEFTVPYRHRAKPLPPQKFLDYAKERSTRHLFSRHDNRNEHSNSGDLEAFFRMGLGKRKYFASSAHQQTKPTADLLTWRGNESKGMLSSYRAEYKTPGPTLNATGVNSTEPLHVRSNLGLRRRQYRVATAPPAHAHRRAMTAPPLLAWNEPDATLHGKPGVGARPLSETQRQRPGGYVMETPWARTLEPTQTNKYAISETVTPLAMTQ